MLDLVKIVITTFSLAYGWIESPLFKRARAFVESKIHPYLVSCYHCVGFYAGLLAILLNYLAQKSVIFSILYNALFLAGTTLLIYRLFFVFIKNN
jgi:hypothetical protein